METDRRKINQEIVEACRVVCEMYCTNRTKPRRIFEGERVVVDVKRRKGDVLFLFTIDDLLKIEAFPYKYVEGRMIPELKERELLVVFKVRTAEKFERRGVHVEESVLIDSSPYIERDDNVSLCRSSLCEVVLRVANFSLLKLQEMEERIGRKIR